jgi:hypothetical protein
MRPRFNWLCHLTLLLMPLGRGIDQFAAVAHRVPSFIHGHQFKSADGAISRAAASTAVLPPSPVNVSAGPDAGQQARRDGERGDTTSGRAQHSTAVAAADAAAVAPHPPAIHKPDTTDGQTDTEAAHLLQRAKRAADETVSRMREEEGERGERGERLWPVCRLLKAGPAGYH